MNTLRPFPALLVVTALTNLLLCAHGDEKKQEFDCSADRRLITQFAAYGYQPTKSIQRDAKSVRFKLPALVKGVEQTALYSLFSLSGDFEISAVFEWLAVPPPQSGYGASIGIAIEIGSGPPILSLARGHLVKQASGSYLVTQGLRDEKGGIKWSTERFPTEAKKGRLVLRREKDVVICLVADDLKQELHELARVPYTDKTARPVRVFADSGGSPTSLDARISALQISALEITGAIPKRDQPRDWTTLIVIGVFSLVGVALYIFWRRERAAYS